MDASLKIIIGADTGDVDKQLQKLESKAASLKKQLEKPINADIRLSVGKELDSVNAEIAKLRQQKIDLQISGTSIQGLQNLETGANKATASITKLKANTGAASNTILNFSRVVSDSPYGIIGVANNIEQLASSFGSLKLQAKESGQSIGQTLLQSLKGPAGLTLGISAVTAALSFAAIGFGAWTRAFKTGGEETDKYKKKIDELKESVKGINNIKIEAAADTDAEIVKVNSLSKAITDTNLTYTQRKNALNELKKVNKEFFGDLTIETATLETLTKRSNEYAKSLIAQAVVTGALDDIKKISNARRLELQTLQELTPEYTKLSKELEDVQKQRNAAISTSGSITGVTSDPLKQTEENIQNRLSTIRTALKKSGSSVDQLTKQFKELESFINQETANSIKIEVPNPDTKKATSKVENDFAEALSNIKKKYAEAKIEIPAPLLLLPKKEQLDALKEYIDVELDLRAKIAIDKQAAREDAYTAGVEAMKEFTRAAEAEANKLVINPILAKIGVKPEYNVAADPTLEERLAAKAQERITNAFKKFGELKINLNLIPNLSGLSAQDQAAGYEQFAEKFAKIQEQAKNTATVISDMLTPAFNSFFQALVSGSGSPFKAFGQAIKQLLVQIAAAIAKALIFKAIMSVLLPGSAAAGTGLGTLIGQAIGLGGNIGGTSAGSISTGGITGSANTGQQRLVTEIRGNSLALILQRTSNTTNRLG